MTTQTEIDIETLLHWAYRDELSKRQTSAAEGIWDRIQEDGQRGGIDKGHGAAQRYAHFGLPDPDAERIEKAVGALEDTVIDWERSFDAIAADLSALISVNDVGKRNSPARAPQAGWGKAGDRALRGWWGDNGARPHKERARGVLMVGGLRTAALVIMHAVQGNRPDWIDDAPVPRHTPAATGSSPAIVGSCEGRNRYSLGSYCPLKYEPSPLSIVSSRAEYAAWHAGLTKLAASLVLAKFIALPPKADPTPWLAGGEAEGQIVPVMPNGANSVAGWGKLPLTPVRGRMGPPLREPKAGPVRYPLVATAVD